MYKGSIKVDVGAGRRAKEVVDEVESLPRHRRGINLRPFSPLAAQRDAKNQGLTRRREKALSSHPLGEESFVDKFATGSMYVNHFVLAAIMNLNMHD